jgi:two-component system capsular synthesis response regulator RcsB
MIRVVLADDHPTVRLGVAHVLQQSGDIQVVAEASTGSELYDALRHQPCDVVLTDFSMPGGGADGLGMLDRLHRQWPTLPVVVLTMIGNPDTLHAMDVIGCTGICDKVAPMEEVVEAVRMAAAGHRYRSTSVQAALSTAAIGQGISLKGRLSPREVEVVRLIGEGLGLEAIAQRLHRSAKTVSRQKRDAMQRLGLETDEALVDYARRTRLVS